MYINYLHGYFVLNSSSRRAGKKNWTSELLASTYFSGRLITVHILLCNFSSSQPRLLQPVKFLGNWYLVSKKSLIVRKSTAHFRNIPFVDFVLFNIWTLNPSNIIIRRWVILCEILITFRWRYRLSSVNMITFNWKIHFLIVRSNGAIMKSKVNSYCLPFVLLSTYIHLGLLGCFK